MADNTNIHVDNYPIALSLKAILTRWNLGLMLLRVVVVLWVVSGFLINSIFEPNIYRKPYLITYLNTSVFTLYLAPFLLRSVLKNGFKYNILPNDGEGSVRVESQQLQNISAIYGDDTPIDDDELPPDMVEPPFTIWETAMLSLQFCVLWFLANLLSNASLSYTSVATSTILTSTSSFFTLLVGAFFKVENISLSKFLTLVLSLIGVIILTLNSSYTQDDANSNAETHTNSHVWLGNLMALGSAFLYGVYTTLLKLKIGNNFETRINMFNFFGFVGLFSLLLLWPVILIFHLGDIESFHLPPTGYVWFVIIFNAIITIASDLCWALALLMTTPLVVTVGLSATIPLAMAGDILFHGRGGNFGYIVGAICVFAAITKICYDRD